MPYCQLCEREVEKTTKHHLTPKQHGGKYGPTADLCRACHNTLHNTFSNKELASTLNTISLLQTSEKLQKYLNWIKNKKIEKLRF